MDFEAKHSSVCDVMAAAIARVPTPAAELLEWANREAANGARNQTELGWGDFPLRARIIRQ